MFCRTANFGIDHLYVCRVSLVVLVDICACSKLHIYRYSRYTGVANKQIKIRAAQNRTSALKFVIPTPVITLTITKAIQSGSRQREKRTRLRGKYI